MFFRWALTLIVLLVVAQSALAGGSFARGRSGGRISGKRNFRTKTKTNQRSQIQSSGGSPQHVNRHYHYSGGGPFSGLGTWMMMSSIMGGGNHGIRQEQYRLENKLGEEEAKIEQLEKELAESKAMRSQFEERMSALEAAR